MDIQRYVIIRLRIQTGCINHVIINYREPGSAIRVTVGQLRRIFVIV